MVQPPIRTRLVPGQQFGHLHGPSQMPGAHARVNSITTLVVARSSVGCGSQPGVEVEVLGRVAVG